MQIWTEVAGKEVCENPQLTLFIMFPVLFYTITLGFAQTTNSERVSKKAEPVKNVISA